MADQYFEALNAYIKLNALQLGDAQNDCEIKVGLSVLNCLTEKRNSHFKYIRAENKQNKAAPTAGTVEVASENNSSKLSSVDIDLSSRFKDGQMVHTKDGNGIVNGHVDGKVLIELVGYTKSYEATEITPF